ncbi:MAG TPA: type II toxin-antitoxin system RelE/ParE family toxin, partial [Acidobacteriota bacterium]
VFLTSDAQADMENILSYIEIHDSKERSDYVYQRIKKAILNLSAFPKRGRVVPELKEIGVLEYREVFFKPYRILYFIEAPHVYVIAIFDGRRDLQELLHRRLFP